MLSYYNPDLKTCTKTSSKKRKDFWSTVCANNQTIRFRHDMKNCPHIFLCNQWPDVKHTQAACNTYTLNENKCPLFTIGSSQLYISFRTLTHFYSYSFFKQWAPELASLFLWSNRHKAAQTFSKCMVDKKERDIQREHKKENPSSKRMMEINAKWFLIKNNGLLGYEARSLSSWECVKNILNITKEEYRRQKLSFEFKYATITMATGIYNMMDQNPDMKRALMNCPNVPIIAVGDAQESFWHSNSGHNLLGELYMNYRSCHQQSPAFNYIKCYETKSQMSSVPRLVQTRNTNSKTDTFKTLHKAMMVAAREKNWVKVANIAKQVIKCAT